jgi:phage anti-repressor protein
MTSANVDIIRKQDSLFNILTGSIREGQKAYTSAGTDYVTEIFRSSTNTYKNWTCDDGQVLLTGSQNISGTKTFKNASTFSDTLTVSGVLSVNEIAKTNKITSENNLEISATGDIYLNSLTYTDYGIRSNNELVLQAGSDGITFHESFQLGGIRSIYSRPTFYLTSSGNEDYGSYFYIEGTNTEVAIHAIGSNLDLNLDATKNINLTSNNDVIVKTNATTSSIILKPGNETTLNTYIQGGDTYFVVTSDIVNITSITNNINITSYNKLKLQAGSDGITFHESFQLGGIRSIYSRPTFYLTSSGNEDYGSYFYIEGTNTEVAIHARGTDLSLTLDATKDIKLETNADTTHIIMKPDGSTTLDTYSQGGDTFFVVTADSIGISSTTSNIIVNSYGKVMIQAGSDGITFHESFQLGGIRSIYSRPTFYLTSSGNEDYGSYFYIEGTNTEVAIHARGTDLSLTLDATKDISITSWTDISLQTNSTTAAIVMKPGGSTVFETRSLGTYKYIAFFGVSPYIQQTSGAGTLTNVWEVLKNYGLIS